MKNTSLTGRAAEEYCAGQLLEEGYTILERNYAWTGHGEIDLIAAKNRCLYFVEVKARKSQHAYGGPAGAMTPAKLKRIFLCAMKYVSDRKLYDYNCRVVAAFVRLDAGSVPVNCTFVPIEV